MRLKSLNLELVQQEPSNIKTMNAYKIKYKDGTIEVVIAKNALEVIKKYDLSTKEHISTRVFQLEGEQKAIALSEWSNQF